MDLLYTKIGEKNIRLLVDRFYEEIYNNSSISYLFVGDKSLIKEKQFDFLSQFFGGPTLYSNKYGHPRLKRRHLPFKIGIIEKQEWMRCMTLSINSLNIEKSIKTELISILDKVAGHMQNSH